MRIQRTAIAQQIGTPDMRDMRAPLFGGYAFAAWTVVWLAGIILQSSPLLAPLSLVVWLAVACGCAILAVTSTLVYRHAHGAPSRAARLMLAVGICACALALGAARAASTSTATAPDSITRLATGKQIAVQGAVVAEPQAYATYRLLTVDVTSTSHDGGKQWQPATGRIEVAVYGPDDWYAPTYGDTIQATGKLDPLPSGSGPAGIVARLGGARVTVEARGGGNPLLAALFDLRVRLALAVQHALPEPEAALLIGILLGLKTPALRARLPLFTATGTIHLVVPAGLKVAVLAELAGRALRPLGWWPRTLGGLAAVALYAALGGGGPAAIRAAIMGTLLVVAPALGRTYNVFTALALAVLVLTALDPLAVYDASFQLTMLATCGLPILTPPLQRSLAALCGRWRNAPLVTAISESLAVTLAAQAATLPVLALTFHEVSLVAPLANLLVVPLLAPLLVLGGALALLGLVSALSMASLALGWIAWPLLWYVNAAIAATAALPYAALSITGTPVALAWLYYAALALAVWGVPRLRRQ